MTFYAAHILGPDTHANRPAAANVPDHAQYRCTTHGITYYNNGGTWATYVADAGDKVEVLMIALGDETTAITTGAAKVTMHMPFDFDCTEVIAGLTAVSTSGAPAFDVNDTGSTIFSTPLTIDANEETSLTAAVPAVISGGVHSFVKGDKVTFDIDTAGTGAKGAKIYLVGTRP